MTSLVNVDANYYVVRSASSATTTVPYNPSGYSLLGWTSLVSGTLSDLVSNNDVYMTFRSYASQTSTTSLSRATIGYRSSTGISASHPKMRGWDGSAWDPAESELPAAAYGPVEWVRMAYSPLMARYYEKIIVTRAGDGYLDAYVWTGSGWLVTNDIAFAPTYGSCRNFDIAYEKTSGRALLAYGISDGGSRIIAYRTWDGSSWSAESYINDSGHAEPTTYYCWVQLASKPTSGTNEICLVAQEWAKIPPPACVRAWIWDGSSWGNGLELETYTNDEVSEGIGVAYESISGYAMFVWGDDATNSYDSRRWLGSSWEGAERVAIAPGVIGGGPGFLTLKSDPALNRIMLLTIARANDLWTADWNPNGMAPPEWTTHYPAHASVDTSSSRCADGDWEPSGNRYLMAYGTTSGFIDWKTWSTASGWSSASTIASTSTHPWIQLRRNPRDVAGVKILGAMLAENSDLGALSWDGSTLSNLGDAFFTADAWAWYECFDIRFQLFGDPTEFTGEVEFTGSSNIFTWTLLVWKVDSAWAESSVTVTVQLYNYNTASYPSSGNGYVSYTSSATPNTDETGTQTITISPQNFRDGSGNWKIKVKGVKATNTRFDFKVDWIEYKTTYCSEYTASTEFMFSGIAGNTLTLLAFTVVSQYDMASVSVKIQVWSYSAGQYVTSGEGYLTYTSSATPSTDETTILAITTNPSYYLSSGNAKIKITGVRATTTQFQQKANQIKLDVHSPVTTTVPTTIVSKITTVVTVSGMTTLTIMGLEHVTHTVILISSTTTSATVTSLSTTTAIFTTSTTTSTSTTSTTTATTTTTRVTTTTETVPRFLAGRCVIATAAYGSELAPEVQFIRASRDQLIGSTFSGSSFVKALNSFYYSFSPTAASVVAQNPLLARMVRVLLYPSIAAIHAGSIVFRSLDFAPELATIVSLAVISTFVGATYLGPIAVAAKIGERRRANKRERAPLHRRSIASAKTSLLSQIYLTFT